MGGVSAKEGTLHAGKEWLLTAARTPAGDAVHTTVPGRAAQCTFPGRCYSPPVRCELSSL